MIERQDVRPRVLRDVPARVLAYRLEADIDSPRQQIEDPGEKHEAIQKDFSTRRTNDALIRTVTSPDGHRVVALYGTDEEPTSVFRIDLYSSDGQFLRNLSPPTLSCVFPETVAWSPDNNMLTFIAHKRATPSPSPTPPPSIIEEPSASPQSSPTVAPSFAPVAAFQTEQIYICNRDGYDLRPLTTREGLIYFAFSWAPDSHALVALACKESEWNARERQSKLPAGRPRLITVDSQERLLDDGLAEAVPVWSPDASKVATAFDTDVAIYDAATDKPTQARLPLRDQLIAASVVYEQKVAAKKAQQANKGNGSTGPAGSPSPVAQTAPQGVPASFNPIVRLEWPSPERLYFQTAYVLLTPNESITTFPRWHLLQLSAQAAVLK
ncbi:MAG TPA: hypothetical protein VLA93_01585 [Pyrinomonadaceae bacterium]|nr:hypothetical protein [Pyrinomonadaceae bacterium]